MFFSLKIMHTNLPLDFLFNEAFFQNKRSHQKLTSTCCRFIKRGCDFKNKRKTSSRFYSCREPSEIPRKDINKIKITIRKDEVEMKFEFRLHNSI